MAFEVGGGIQVEGATKLLGTLEVDQGSLFKGNVEIQGTLTVAGYSADLLDGLHASDFVKIATAQTITVRHTFNPSYVTSPFIIGNNAAHQRVEGLNADRVDGYDAGNANGNIPISNGTACVNLNADLLDGYHASSFAQTSALSSYLPLSGGTLTGTLNAPIIVLPESGYSTWSLDPDQGKLTFKNGSTVLAYFINDGTFYFLGGAGNGVVYAKHFDCGRYGGIVRAGAVEVGNDTSGYLSIELSGSYMYAKNVSDAFIWKADTTGFYIPGQYLTASSTVDTSDPSNDKWSVLNSAIKAYKAHDIKLMHQAIKSETVTKRSKTGKWLTGGLEEADHEEVVETTYSINDLLQIAVECIADLKQQLDAKGVL